LSAALFVITWIITFQLLLRSPANDHSDHQNAAKNPGDDHWVQAATTGIALLVAAVFAIAVSPSDVDVNFGVNSLSPGPRVNFVATIGIALALPALFALLAQWSRRFIRLVQCHPRSMRLLGLAGLACLIYVGFIGFPAYGTVFSHKSAVPILFARYSLAYGLLVVAYVFVMVLVGGMVVLPSVSYLRNTRLPPIVNQIETLVPRMRAHCLSWAVACIVLFGTLFHLSIKEEFADEWRRHKAMLEQLHGIAPALEDDTFVIIVHEELSRSVSMPYMTHSELSSFLLALYANWSIMGTTDRNIRFYPDGVEARYYGKVAMWLPPGVKAPATLYTALPVPQISYDRLLLFSFDGTSLRLLPEMEVEIEGKGRGVVMNNPERILDQTPLRTAIWRHVTD
jgi:MFS family permease